MQHLAAPSYGPAWQHLAHNPSPNGMHGSSYAASPQCLSQYDSPPAAKRSKSSRGTADVDMDARRLRPSLPRVQTSVYSNGLPTPPLSSSSSISSAGSSLGSFSSFPRSFSMQNWMPSSAGFQGYDTPAELNPKSGRPLRGHQTLCPEDMQTYASSGFATPALRPDETHDRVSRPSSYPGFPVPHSQTPQYPSISLPSELPTPPPAPALDAQHLQLSSPEGTPTWDQEKCVEGLVGTSMLAIESIWSTTATQSSDKSCSDKVLPLKYFIKETLRRSRSGITTLQVALYYLHRARVPIRERVALAECAKERFAHLSALRKESQERHLAETGLASPPSSPNEEFTNAASEVLATSRDPVVCGRRMFLAALICASKFLQDRNYSNRAWSRLSGLPVTEINANERSFLDVLNYELFVKPEIFASWTARLHKLAVDNGARVLRLVGTTESPQSMLKRSNTDYTPAPEHTERPCGAMPHQMRSNTIRPSLSVSTTELDLHRRRLSLGPQSAVSTPSCSPMSQSRRASDAIRYTSSPSYFQPNRSYGQGTSYISSLRRPSMSRRMSSAASDCRPASFRQTAVDVC